jgi:hypothetical protein
MTFVWDRLVLPMITDEGKSVIWTTYDSEGNIIKSEKKKRIK